MGLPRDTVVADTPDGATPSDASTGMDTPQGDGSPAGDAGDLSRYDPFNPNPRGTFPPGFLWGSATAPYQIEGGLENTDWHAWEEMPGRIAHGDHADDGDQSYTNYPADLDALVATHQNAYRLGIDWSRLFPTASAWAACRGALTMPLPAFVSACRAAASPAGLAYYHSVLSAMTARHLTAMVTLHHFVFPTYLDDLSQPPATQGFAVSTVVDDLGAYARFVGAEYGSQVDYWITINEPFAYIAAGYLQGSFPPGVPFDPTLATTVVRNMIYAHARAYDALHEADTVSALGPGDGGTVNPPARVSIASHNRVFRPLNASSPADVQGARTLHYINNLLFLNAIVYGNLDANANGVLTDPGDLTNAPDLRGRADFVGINYYGLTLVLGAAIPVVQGLPEINNLPTPLPKTDVGWDIYPQGFIEVLDEANTYGLPIIVTENGIADSAGVNRPRFIAEHLAALATAIHRGDDVRGYFHWSIIDNFEWASGFCPHFGLYHVDMTSPMRTRTPAPGADTYRQIIDANQVTDALLTAVPAYGAPTPCM